MIFFSPPFSVPTSHWVGWASHRFTDELNLAQKSWPHDAQLIILERYLNLSLPEIFLRRVENTSEHKYLCSPFIPGQRARRHFPDAQVSQGNWFMAEISIRDWRDVQACPLRPLAPFRWWERKSSEDLEESRATEWKESGSLNDLMELSFSPKPHLTLTSHWALLQIIQSLFPVVTTE